MLIFEYFSAVHRGHTVRHHTRASVGRATIPAELCQPKEIVLIQVSGERVLSENKLKRKRQSDQRRQEVIGGKRFEKNAHGRREESKRRQEKA